MMSEIGPTSEKEPLLRNLGARPPEAVIEKRIVLRKYICYAVVTLVTLSLLIGGTFTSYHVFYLRGTVQYTMQGIRYGIEMVAYLTQFQSHPVPKVYKLWIRTSQTSPQAGRCLSPGRNSDVSQPPPLSNNTIINYEVFARDDEGNNQRVTVRASTTHYRIGNLSAETQYTVSVRANSRDFRWDLTAELFSGGALTAPRPRSPPCLRGVRIGSSLIFQPPECLPSAWVAPLGTGCFWSGTILGTTARK